MREAPREHIFAFGLVFLLGHALLAYTIPPGPQAVRFWGGNAVRMLPAWGAAVLYGGALAGIAAGLFSPRRGASPGPSHRALGPVLILLAVALFALFRFRYALLGDNSLRVAQAESGASSPHEGGIMAVYHLLVGALAPAGLTGRSVFALVSLASGALYASVAWLIAGDLALTRSLGRKERILIFAGLLSCGTAALFCGYIEVYPPIAALLLLLVWLARRAVRGEAPAFVPVLLAGLLVLLHHGALLWAPLAAAPLLLRRADARRSRLLAAGVAGASLVAGILLAGRTSILLPLFPSAERPYAALSAAHLSDWLNAQLLASVAGFLLGPAALVRFFRFLRRGEADGDGPRGAARTAESALLLLAWLPPAVGLFFFRPLLGAADWDVLALPGPFAFLFAADWALGRRDVPGRAVPGGDAPERAVSSGGAPGRAVPSRAAPSRPAPGAALLFVAVLLSAANTAPWLVLARSEASLRWVADLVRFDSADYYAGHPPPLQLAFVFGGNGLAALQQEELERGLAEYPEDPRFPYNLAVLARGREDWDGVERYAERAYRSAPGYFPPLFLLYEAGEARGRREEQLLLGRVILERAESAPDQVARTVSPAELASIRSFVAKAGPDSGNPFDDAKRSAGGSGGAAR